MPFSTDALSTSSTVQCCACMLLLQQSGQRCGKLISGVTDAAASHRADRQAVGSATVCSRGIYQDKPERKHLIMISQNQEAMTTRHTKKCAIRHTPANHPARRAVRLSTCMRSLAVAIAQCVLAAESSLCIQHQCHFGISSAGATPAMLTDDK